MIQFNKRRLVSVLSAMGLLGLSAQTFASAFQIWEQDTVNVSNFHAGYAAAANNASIAFYNPAGITRFKNQQVVFTSNIVTPDIKYTGNVFVDTINNGVTPLPATAQGGTFNFIPALNYVAPLTEDAGFGFTIDVPFAAKTNYGNATSLRYVATETRVAAVDISPSFGIKLSEKASVGVGVDIQKMQAEFDQVGTLGGADMDSDGIDEVDGTGYGMHAGVLYEFTPDTRVGISYHSQVVHHLTGRSSFSGPVADALNGNTTIKSTRSKVDMTLPAYTALSAYHLVQPQVAVMATAIYTQWNIIRDITLLNASGVVNAAPSNTITVVVPQNFRNSWSLSVGADYYATDSLTLRSGIGVDQTPVQNAYRTVQLPDNNHYVIALGGHYQATKTIGADLGWSHIFMKTAHVNPPPQVTGAQTSITDGSVRAGADVFSAQIVWDIV